MTPDQPPPQPKLPTPNWSQPMGLAGLVHAMSAALLAHSWVEAAALARKVEIALLDEGEPT